MSRTSGEKSRTQPFNVCITRGVNVVEANCPEAFSLVYRATKLLRNPGDAVAEKWCVRKAIRQ